MFLILLMVCPGLVYPEAAGPPGPLDFSSAMPHGNCGQCHWTSHHGAFYDLSHVCEKKYELFMQNPRGASLQFAICSVVSCEEKSNSAACIHVPGNRATSTGSAMVFEQMELNIPSAGVRLRLSGGDTCAANMKARKTIIDFLCQPDVTRHESEPRPTKAWEGENTDICTYYITFPSPYGCPTHHSSYQSLSPKITAVTGCLNSVPNESTTECHPAGGSTLTIHGLDFQNDQLEVQEVSVRIHNVACTEAAVVNAWTITCQLREGTGEGLAIHVVLKWKDITRSTQGQPVTREVNFKSSKATVSYKPLVDYKSHFASFLELGVGGLGPQIRELYQRAFASRSVPASVLTQMGIEHAKGILLHGPPGSGKTLLARTISKIMHTNQVKLINAPEVMSKYLGESEKNLRSYFDEAEKAWDEMGESSDLFVIIIDEIDAICKSRGKGDTSAAAAAYDSVVNQLLTKMDGLKTIHNVVVIGLTNRPELIDPALLRPGRFEIQIEIGLPDLRGRWEIFYIHTKSMRENGYLSPDVSLDDLAGNTTQFSGAEIAGVVRLAASYAIDRKYGNGTDEFNLQVTEEDFATALRQMTPAHTETDRHIIKEFLPRGFLACGNRHSGIVLDILQKAESLEFGSYKNIESVLLYGPRGVGKSGIAAHIATSYKFTSVKVITAHSQVRLHEAYKSEILIDAFHDAQKADLSLIILDNLHQIAEVVTIGKETKASSTILSTLSVLMSAQPVRGSKILVIGTMLSEGVNLGEAPTGKVGLQELFLSHIYVPRLNAIGALSLLEDLSIYRQGGHPFKLPSKLSISLRNMLEVTDCVEYKSRRDSLSLTATTQDIMDQCLHLYPHIEPFHLNLS